MIKGKRKSIISLILACTMLLPSYLVRADEVNSTNLAEKIENVIVEDKGTVLNSGEKYEVETIEYPVMYSLNNNFERIELQLKAESIGEKKLLKTKTDSPYEIALAYSDGSYTYVDKADTLEEAKDIISKISTTYSEDIVIPTIINNDGQVVYGTRTMGRIWKHLNGVPDTTINNVTNVYTTKELTSTYTSINQGYVDDVPVIEDAGTSARILVNGYKGWVNKDASSKDYDLVLVPINQVTNPSYYYSEGGLLYHFISSNMTSSTQKGVSNVLGLAPNYLKEGVRYFSYDGNYFYNGQNIAAGLDLLIADLQQNVTSNAINKDNPYYSYFEYLPFRSKSNYTATDLDKYINDKTDANSKLRGMGQAFIQAQEKYGVNALLALGVAINESNWGTSNLANIYNNLFGLGANDFFPEGADKFNSPADSIDVFAKEYISRGYADPADWRYFGGYLGNKKNGANVKYASDPFWGEKAAKYALMIDYYLSNNDISRLKDYDAEQLIMYTANNKVINSKRSLLYNIQGAGKDLVGTIAVVTNSFKRLVDGQELIEINSERNTPVNNGGSANKYHGAYDWNSKGYIVNSNYRYINTKKISLDNIYVQAYYSTIEARDNPSQVLINKARIDINELKEQMPTNSDIPTWSSILDEPQGDIFKVIVDNIILLNEKVNSGQKLKQEEVNKLRILQLNDWNDFTDDIPLDYLVGANYGWSELTDKLQNVIINYVVDAVVKAEADKTQESIYAAKAVINNMKTAVDPSMVSWAESMENRLNKLR